MQFGNSEVTRTTKARNDDVRGLRVFRDDYPMAKTSLLYLGNKAYLEGDTRVIPLDAWLRDLPAFLRE